MATKSIEKKKQYYIKDPIFFFHVICVLVCFLDTASRRGFVMEYFLWLPKISFLPSLHPLRSVAIV